MKNKTLMEQNRKKGDAIGCKKRVNEDVNLINFCKEDGSHGHRRKSQQKNTKKIITYIKWWETR